MEESITYENLASLKNFAEMLRKMKEHLRIFDNNDTGQLSLNTIEKECVYEESIQDHAVLKTGFSWRKNEVVIGTWISIFGMEVDAHAINLELHYSGWSIKQDDGYTLLYRVERLTKFLDSKSSRNEYKKIRNYLIQGENDSDTFLAGIISKNNDSDAEIQ